jgi:hypothetical protein
MIKLSVIFNRVWISTAVLVLVGCSGLPQNQSVAVPSNSVAASTISELENKFGIQIISTKLSGNNYLVDVRYRVIDGEKARPILDKAVKPALIHALSGDRFYVPTQPIVGSLRQTVGKSRIIVADKVYFLLFANPNQKLKVGDQVSLAIGEFSKSNLAIQ